MIIVPFFLTKKEPKKSSAIRSSNRRMARATAPRSDSRMKPTASHYRGFATDGFAP